MTDPGISYFKELLRLTALADWGLRSGVDGSAAGIGGGSPEQLADTAWVNAPAGSAALARMTAGAGHALRLRGSRVT